MERDVGIKLQMMVKLVYMCDTSGADVTICYIQFYSASLWLLNIQHLTEPFRDFFL